MNSSWEILSGAWTQLHSAVSSDACYSVLCIVCWNCSAAIPRTPRSVYIFPLFLRPPGKQVRWGTRTNTMIYPVRFASVDGKGYYKPSSIRRNKRISESILALACSNVSLFNAAFPRERLWAVAGEGKKKAFLGGIYHVSPTITGGSSCGAAVSESASTVVLNHSGKLEILRIVGTMYPGKIVVRRSPFVLLYYCSPDWRIAQSISMRLWTTQAGGMGLNACIRVVEEMKKLSDDTSVLLKRNISAGNCWISTFVLSIVLVL